MHLKQRTWIANQYLNLQKSPDLIAKEYGCSRRNVLYWLGKFGIPMRSYSQAQRIARSNHVTLTSEALEFLNGELLEDGHLEHFEWSSVYRHTSKYRGYLEWLSKELDHYGIIQSGKINRRVGKIQYKGQTSSSEEFRYRSLSYAELGSLQHKWYRPATVEEKKKRRKFIKVVPKDLGLTPLILRQWYLGDGYLCHDGPKWTGLGLSTLGFSRCEVLFLANLLEKLGLAASIRASRETYVFC